MKTIQIILLFISINALQAQTIDKSSIDAGGTSIDTASISVIYSIGEVVVQEYNIANLKVSEGFISLTTQNNTLSVEDLNTNELSLFPNPVSNYFNVVTENTTIKQININDINGRQIFKIENLNTNTKQLDVSALQKGVYIATVISKNGVLTQRFIKN